MQRQTTKITQFNTEITALICELKIMKLQSLLNY